MLAHAKTSLMNITGRLTGYIQVVDVGVNKPFKDEVRKQSEQHMNDNLDIYTSGKLTAGERRILVPKWCANAWAKVDREMVIRTFKKCGINTSLDGSEDDQVSISKLPDYVMSEGREEEFDLLSDDDSSSQSDDERNKSDAGSENGNDEGGYGYSDDSSRSDDDEMGESSDDERNKSDADSENGNDEAIN